MTVAAELDAEIIEDKLDVYDCPIPDWLSAYLNQRQDEQPGSRLHSLPEMELISKAFLFAHRLHQGQKRKSGEPYIAHPVQVATLLRELWADGATIAAGFLHDVVEDTEITAEEIERRFGQDVRHLVEGVTKVSKFNFSSKTAQQAENFRRMFLSMAKDIRVIVVKLADRLHNMRTLEYLPEAKQKLIAAETMGFFAPLASRLGMWKIKWELEDLSFKYLEPEAYQETYRLVATRRTEREEQIQSFMTYVETQLQQAGLESFEMSGRPKHLYSIYNKMRRQNKEFQEIYDLYAVRIIVQSTNDCYAVIAVLHQAFRLIPGRFKDYISMSKPNGYQSLHTTVMGPAGSPVEVQIRTAEMHRIAELGIAAHWKYKEAGHSTAVNADEERFMWLRQLVEWQSHLQDDKEYLETIHQDLFQSLEAEVCVFTRGGDLYSLPKGSCPIDFAYRIHSEVGNHCAGVLINKKMAPLNTVLRNGDIVEILTQKNAHPSMDWMNFVQTSSARNRIRQWFKRSNRDENMVRGRQLLERELGKGGLESLLKSDRMQKVVERLNFTQVDDLLASLGQGETTINSVVNKLQESAKPAPLALPHSSKLSSSSVTSDALIQGLEGLKHRLAQCCHPLPGDPIMGVVTRFDRSISIHQQSCKNVMNIPGDRLIPLNWNQKLLQDRPTTYPVDIQLEVIDRVGVFNDILARLKDGGINVRNAHVDTYPNKLAAISICLDIRDRAQLTALVTQLRQLVDVVHLKCPHILTASAKS